MSQESTPHAPGWVEMLDYHASHGANVILELGHVQQVL